MGISGVGFYVVALSGIMAFASGVLLVERTMITRDYALLARAIPRFYLAVACLLYVSFPTDLDMTIIGMGVFLLLFADTVVGILFLAGKKYRDEAVTNQMIDLLEKTHNKYAAILDNCQVGFFIIDLRGRIEYVNNAFLRLIGNSKENSINQNIFDYLPEGTKKVVQEKMKEKAAGNAQVTCYETVIKTKDGRMIPVRVASYPTKNGHDTITGSIVPINSEDYDCIIPPTGR